MTDQEDIIGTDIKLIVTHKNPDPDAIGACWLLSRFGGAKFEGARFFFVSAGQEIGSDILEAKEIASNEVVHVDTGMGVFDHHQPGHTERDSATKIVHEYLTNKYPEHKDNQALARVVHHINEGDHFAECYWPEANADRYVFMFDTILQGLRSGRHFNDHEIVDFGMICLDGILTSMKVKVSAEEDLKTLGVDFESPWGKALSIENHNDEVIDLAQKSGYLIVVRKDSQEGHVRIKAVPDRDIDLTKAYREIKKLDQEGTWFLHPSKTMLLNGSKKSAMHTPTPLSLEEIVSIIRSSTT